jgi:endonuclease-3
MSASSPRRKTTRRSEGASERHRDESRRDESRREADGESRVKTTNESGVKTSKGSGVKTSSKSRVKTSSESFIEKGGARLSSAVEAWVATVTEEKPVRYIVQNLERAYGVPVNKWTGWDVLDMLVAVILSQATSDANSDRTYDALKKRFPTWDAVLRARESTLADTIRLGGLANQKAAVIRELLREIKERHGTLDLSFLRDMSDETAVCYLAQFRGIGPKTAACTLLFACGKETFPLDTHIFRVLRRVSLIPAKCSDHFAHEALNRLVPEGKFYSFHVNLIRHGRKLCRPRDPLCERCPIVEYCDYGRERI